VSVVGYRAQNHPQQVRTRGADPEIDDRATTIDLFGPLNAQYRFTIDVAASPSNTKCLRFYSIEQDGLTQPWAGERVWCNPPYSSIAPWVAKAWREDEAQLVVMLLPSNRTEQEWWQHLVEPHRDRRGSRLTVKFLPGRPRFMRRGSSQVGPNERPPFGLALLVWRLASHKSR
jgi:phage N-6-adenine-methyltransferase